MSTREERERETRIYHVHQVPGRERGYPESVIRALELLDRDPAFMAGEVPPGDDCHGPQEWTSRDFVFAFSIYNSSGELHEDLVLLDRLVEEAFVHWREPEPDAISPSRMPWTGKDPES
jgi:hypothetical protein